ncbi:MAG: low molecular weight protein-tyrosine-phosphatase [Bulleidia sp.]
MMIRILFVCHGNICRSVSAQYIMQDLAEKAGKKDEIYVDSAATSAEEIGNLIYPPMRRTLSAHGVPIGTHAARKLKRSDYESFDLLIGMDSENSFCMRRILGEDPAHKIHFLMEYTDTPDREIEDPWYTRDFEQAYQDILTGCEGLLGLLTSSGRIS